LRSCLETIYPFNNYVYLGCEWSGLWVFDIKNLGIEEKQNKDFTYTMLKISPNPASKDIRFTYALPESDKITINLYDLTGRKLKNIFRGFQEAGIHMIEWQISSKFPAGIYFCVLETENNKRLTSKILIIH